MKALVTGAAGFIGSHLVDRLLAEGHVVYAVDIGPCEDLHRRHARSGRLWVRQEDAARYTDYADCEVVFHLAGRAELIPSLEDPSGYFEANVRTTMTVLEQARRMGSRVIYAASSSCYGVNPPLPTREDAPIAPAHPYALTKHMGEELVLHYGQVYGLPVVSLRLFNVYGPRARTSGAYGAVIGTFLAQKANGARLTIVGDGTQRRDFVHVDDVVEAFLLAATAKATGVFNIGGGYPTSINAVARLIGGRTVHVPARGGEPRSTWAHIIAADAGLKWRPTISLPEGLDRLIKDLTPWKSAPVWTPETIEKATATWATHLG
jgi:UDP-glucose 4-epimerase